MQMFVTMSLSQTSKDRVINHTGVQQSEHLFFYLNPGIAEHAEHRIFHYASHILHYFRLVNKNRMGKSKGSTAAQQNSGKKRKQEQDGADHSNEKRQVGVFLPFCSFLARFLPAFHRF